MKKRIHKRSALLVFGLLLSGMSLACYVWVREAQRQSTLDRQLITALLKNDTKQALVLVEAGADPNTKEEQAPVPSLPSLIQHLLHPAPQKPNISRTAFLIACGSGALSSKNEGLPAIFMPYPLDPQLTQAMLLHGANVNAKYRNVWTALHTNVIKIVFGAASPEVYRKDTAVIKQLLAYGADPDGDDNAQAGRFGRTPMKSALAAASAGKFPRPDILALLRKYRKHR